MPTIAPKSESKPRVLPPQGTHIARVIRFIELGTQKVEWKGEEKEQYKIWLDFELVDKTHVFKEGEEPKPFVVGSKLTFSMGSKANLRKIVEGIIGVGLLDHEAEAFDIEQLLGKACLVNIKNVTKNDKTYTNIETTTPLMEGMTAKEAFNPITKLTFTSWSKEIFESLPNFLKDQITASPQFNRMNNPKPIKEAKPDLTPANPTEEDEGINISDIPF